MNHKSNFGRIATAEVQSQEEWPRIDMGLPGTARDGQGRPREATRDGQGRPRTAKDGQGRLRTAKDGQGRLRTAKDGQGRPSTRKPFKTNENTRFLSFLPGTAKDGQGRPKTAKDGQGRPRTAKDGQGRPRVALGARPSDLPGVSPGTATNRSATDRLWLTERPPTQTPTRRTRALVASRR